MMNKLVIEDLPHYNYEDYKLWEGDWELIRGIPYAMAPAASWWHQDFGGAFVEVFRQGIKKKRQPVIAKYCMNVTGL